MPLRLCRALIAVIIVASLTLLTNWPARLAHSSSASTMATRPTSDATAPFPALHGNEAIEQLKQQGAYDSLAEAMAATKYEARQQHAEGFGAAYELRNPANHLRASISPGGIQVTSLDSQKAAWQLGLALKGYGYGKQEVAVGGGAMQAAGARVEIARQSGLIEWFVNSAQGIEHGFDISAPPAGQKSAGPLQLRLAVSGDFQPSVNESGTGAAFKSKSGSALVSYDKLYAADATGRSLPATMKMEGAELVIEVTDQGAQYPLTIDPLLRFLQQLTASDGAATDQFGISVAISGDTAVVGAFGDDVGANDQGSAYVFVRSDATWTQQAKLTASDGAATDQFGISVAISGDSIVVGAFTDDVGANDQGSAYVFTRSGATWVQQAKLIASDGAGGDQFGFSVAISGDSIVVGAPFDNVGANPDQGSAYVFVRSGATWVQQAKLIAADGANSDLFGSSAAISGDTVVVGAPNDDALIDQGSAYVFVRSGVTWSQQQKLTASDGDLFDLFGTAVAISGNTIIVGAYQDDVGANNDQGSAYVFVRSGTTWVQQAKLIASDGADFDQFGNSVAISGDRVVVGAPFHTVGANNDQGSAYVFTRSGAIWTQEQQLTAPDGGANDRFSLAVAISGSTIVVGAALDDVGANNNQGSAYLFVGNWNEQAKLTAFDGTANDVFGRTVAFSGDTVVVGAFTDDIGPNADQGSAYVFVRSGASWTLQQKLTAPGGAANDQFGNSVAISGDTLIVGAFLDDVGANVDQGSAYVFVRSGVNWTQQAQLTAADGAAGDRFGSVAISGDTIVVGAGLDDIGGNTNQGSAYVFTRGGVTWSQQAKLTAADGGNQDQFSNALAISGDTIVIGAALDDVGANADQGSAYVFVRSGTSWTQQAQLTASDGAAGDQFGIGVGISGDSIVVGAFDHDIGANADQGAAYVFTRNGTGWTQQAQLTAADGAAGDLFGRSAAISGDTIIIGSSLDDIGANVNQGSAYVFTRSGATWYQQQQLTASDAAAGDDFGQSVALSGNTIVVSSVGDDIGANADQGSAYVYTIDINTTPTIDINTISQQKGSPATASTIANVSDSEDPWGFLSVSVASAPTGISLTNLTNTNGVITASVAATCAAALGNNFVTLQVTDSDGGVGSAQLLINVTANSVPALGSYADTAVAVTSSVSVSPSVPPSDNGSIVSLTATAPTFAGGLSVNPDDGVVMIDNARPGGTHVVTITAIDNCGASRSRAFILTVNCQNITVNPATIPAGTAGSPYSQTFTQSGGNGAVSFTLTGVLPTGLSFNAGSATLSGTPTQVGSFPITITATDQNNCAGLRSYTLDIAAPLLTWTGATSSNWHTASNWSPALVPAAYSDVLIPSSGVTNQPTISASSAAINAMTIQAGRVLTINSSRQLATAADLSSSGQITGAGKLQFNGLTFTQNGAVSVAAVEFNTGAHLLLGGGAFASNIITILNGATVTLASNHTVSVVVINSGGALDLTDRTLTLTGAGTALFNSGSVTATNSTIIYQGAVAQVVTANLAYNNLTINNPAGVALAANTTVAGQLNLLTDLTTGTFTLTMPASGTSAGTADVVGNVKRTGFVIGTPLSFGNPFNTIRFNAATVSLPTDVTMNLSKSAPANFTGAVTRTYLITPNGGSGLSATLRLHYNDSELGNNAESALQLWRLNGGSWSPQGQTAREATDNWVELNGVTSFSSWTIASCSLLSSRSQFFNELGGPGSVNLSLRSSCGWMITGVPDWISLTSADSGNGNTDVTFEVRENFTRSARQVTIIIAEIAYTIVQDGGLGEDCQFAIFPTFAAYSASGGSGTINVVAEERCAWQASSNVSWITITSVPIGIGNAGVTYSVAPNPNASGRAGVVTIAGKTFAVKQKGN